MALDPERTGQRKPRIWLIALPAGIALLVGLVAWQGFSTIAASLQDVGWRVVLLVPLFGIALVAVTTSWAQLMGQTRPSWGSLFIYKWIGFSTNWLLPVAQVGGEVARARLLEGGGVARPDAIAGVIADKTVQSVGIVTHALSGLLFLALLAPSGRSVLVGGIGAVVLVALLFGFYRVQRGGMKRLGRWVAWIFPQARRDGVREALLKLRSALDVIYEQRSAVAIAFALELLFRALITFEILLVADWLGTPISFSDGLIIEGVTQVFRAGSFLIPGSLGVQEGAFVMLGGFVGLSPEVAIAASLVRRSRMLLVGLPGLAVWQLLESRRRKRKKPGPEVSED